MKNMDEVKERWAEVEAKARMTDYDDDRSQDMPSLEAGRFRGYLSALCWVLGEDEEEKIVCQDRGRFILREKIRSVFVRSGLKKECSLMLTCPYCRKLFGVYIELRKEPRPSTMATIWPGCDERPKEK